MESILNGGWAEQGGELLRTREGEDFGSSSRPELMAQLMDELAHGILVVSLSGYVLHANQAALQAMRRSGLLSVRERRLQTRNPDDAKVLQGALNRAAEGKRGLISLQGHPGDARLSLTAVPLKNEMAGATQRIALFFSRVAVYEPPMLNLFARNHGLTLTEEQVLGVLCHGYSTPEIAVQMGVAVSTVRSHVRSLCAKTRSSGVRELVNRVAVLPPVAPSPVGIGPAH